MPAFPPNPTHADIYTDEYLRRWIALAVGINSENEEVFSWRKIEDYTPTPAMRSVQSIGVSENQVIYIPGGADHTLVIYPNNALTNLQLVLPTQRFDGQVVVIKNTGGYDVSGKTYLNGEPSGAYQVLNLSNGNVLTLQWHATGQNWITL